MNRVKDRLKIEDIMAAHDIVKDVVKKTPLQKDEHLSEKYRCTVYLKREDLQFVRSFKLRGAYHCIRKLPEDEWKNGVVCASAGNHAQGVAYTCHKLGIQAAIFMPMTTPKQKVSQVHFFGKSAVKIILTGETFDHSYQEAMRYCNEHKMTFIHPFDNLDVIAGQGTVGIEIVQDIDHPIDYTFMTIGGGGLISGTGTYIKTVHPSSKIIGVEPAGAACMKASLKKGEVVTLPEIDKFVDGAAVKRPGEITYSICRKIVDDLVVVPEGKACSALLDLYTNSAVIAEPAGALPVAALDFYKDKIVGKTVVCVISGGNNDIDRMQEIQERSRLYEGIRHYFAVNLPQRSKALKLFFDQVIGSDDEIVHIHFTEKRNKPFEHMFIGVEFENMAKYMAFIDRMNALGIIYQEVTDGLLRAANQIGGDQS
ncbi:threonine ammonia-lyase IlvA [Sporolactobacillus shoreicorticis]|uniref:L-threonine dehydratase n=1 Tax=Sporolactobacillus shoreicorticis TaxID=1923877 RepID=A0ABW5S4Y9_9BACL|nr:threonine ammonia-lyase IlvA [Sporolactobacillus shoreicorticis]MCO7126537.1 threonine ammonia-lyase IlvA [Sporolactobacillus shoreicorticis]